MSSSTSSGEDRPIRSVKEFIKRYWPSATECPHCNGTGMIRGGANRSGGVDYMPTTKSGPRRVNDRPHGTRN